MPRLGFGELLVLLFVVLLLFGAKRLPELAGSVGKTIKAFKEGLRENEDSSKTDSNKRT
jgi:sec-independent protein translocase protein TatA